MDTPDRRSTVSHSERSVGSLRNFLNSNAIRPKQRIQRLLHLQLSTSFILHANILLSKIHHHDITVHFRPLQFGMPKT